jgi:D-alanine-D-alanine ligase
VRSKIAIIYNEPSPSRYQAMGEEKAVLGVLDEVEAVHKALTDLKYPIVRAPLSPPLKQVREKLKSLKVDLVFNLFEGFDGRPETEAIVAGMLVELRLVHTGCPASALALALDKSKTNIVLQSAGVPTPEYQLLSPENLSIFYLNFPCIVKPRAEDASHGISEESVVYDFTALGNQVRKISQFYGGEAMVEEFIDGREFNVTVLGDREPIVLPISETVYSLPPGVPRILTFAAKWDPESIYFRGSQVTCPAEIDEDTRQRIAQAALSAFKLVGCSGYARVDFRMSNEGEPKVIEVNPNPDISPEYGVARQAQAVGMSYDQLIERIVALAFEKERIESKD